MTRTRRTLLVAVAVAAIVVAANASEGAYFSQSWGWVALAFLAPTTVALVVGRAAAPGRLRSGFAVLMGAFALWVALSAFWSLSVPASVREGERMLVYLGVALAVALVLRRGDASAVVGGALVGVVAVVTYGLATRLFPDRFGFTDDPFNAYRLAEPLGYWNSFGLLAAVGVVLALGCVSHARRSRSAVAAAAALPVLASALYFTFSRGSLLALAFGLLVWLVVDPRRLRVLWAGLALAPAVVAAVAYCTQQDALTTEDSAAAAAAREGHRVAWVVAALVPLAAVLGLLAHRIAERVPVGDRPRRIAGAALAGVAVFGITAGIVAGGGPGEISSNLRARFDAAPIGVAGNLNDRLFTVSGNGRSETIGVAWEVASAHELAGTGAGTFEYVWYERRPSLQIVRDAHSLYAETFAELGVVGLGLLLALLVLPLVAAFRARRVRLVPPAAAAYVAWVAAASLDWHWEMVGLSLSALLLGGAALVAAERGRPRPLGPRIVVLAAVTTAALSGLAVWSLVGNQALFAAREAAAREEWSAAADHARRAESLLVWSHEPELALGVVAAGAGDRSGALDAFRDATDEDPENWVAWLQLAQVARGAERAAAFDRVRELNPREGGLPGE